MHSTRLLTRSKPLHGQGGVRRVVRYGLRCAVMLCLLMIACLPLAAQQGEVIRAYPAVYDLKRIADGQGQVLAVGDVLLKEGRSVRISGPASGAAGHHGVTLDLVARRSEQTPQRLAVSVTGDIVVRTVDERRMELDDREGFIAGYETHRITFENHGWLSLDDPSPVQLTQEVDGVAYVFTLMLQAPAFR